MPAIDLDGFRATSLSRDRYDHIVVPGVVPGVVRGDAVAAASSGCRNVARHGNPPCDAETRALAVPIDIGAGRHNGGGRRRQGRGPVPAAPIEKTVPFA